MSCPRPIILKEGEYGIADLNKLRDTKSIWQEHDIYQQQLKELFEIKFPSLLASKKRRDDFVKKHIVNQRGKLNGNWVYFSWNGNLIHTVREKEYTEIRTNRNRDLINIDEQRRLRNFNVGFIGLSVGSNIATTLAYSGIADKIKFAEYDILETTNLNRIRASIHQIGEPKINIVAQQIYEINPYAKLQYFPEGITKKNISNFIIGKPKLNLIFEIADNFEIKIRLRILARKYGVPVIMITNLGDRVLIDVERYDLNKNTQFFNGRAGKIPDSILRKPDVTDKDKHKYAVELAGIKNIPQRALHSVKKIGTILVGRPQLASTVTIAAGFSNYLTRKIALSQYLPSSSWLIDMDKIFNEKSDYRLLN